MTATALSQEVLDELQALRKQRLDDLGRRPVAWLALVPAWTERLAVACAFPTSADMRPEATQTAEAELEAFLRAAVSSNVCVRGAPPAAGGLIAWHQARALAGLVPYLSPTLRAQALERARTFADPQCRITVLTAALPHLPRSETIAQAELLVEDMKKLPPRERTEALAHILPVLADDLRQPLLGEALEAVRSVPDDEDRARLLAALGPHLAAEFLEVAVVSARAIAADGPRAGALGALAAIHPEPARALLERAALHAASRVEPAGARARELLALIPVLAGQAREDALEAIVRAAEAAGPTQETADDLIELMPLLSGERSDRALSVALNSARAIESVGERAKALAALLPNLTGQAKADLTREAIAAAEELFDPVERVAAFAAIAQGSEMPGLRERALEERKSIQNQVSAARAALCLSPIFPDLGRDALPAIELLPDDREKVGAMLQLAALGSSHAELLLAARRLADLGARADALIGLAPRLAATDLEEALGAALSIETSRTFWMPDGMRAEVLHDLRQRYDLRLISSEKDVSDVPTKGKELIIVAAADDALHFRIFDGDGELVVEIDEKRLAAQARQIEDLRRQLVGLWPPHWLTDSEKDQIITAVTSMFGDTLRRTDSGSPEDRTWDKSNGWISLWREAQALGNTLSRRRQDGDPLPAPLGRWAELASGLPPAPGPAGRRLIEQVRMRTEARETGEAQAWLQAGKLLALALQGDLAAAVKAGEHALELAAWRAQDLRQLRHFLNRNDQIEEFERLVESRRGESWALHYLGLGGVGKTTLIRHITARLAPRMKIATARVDFDYLSPNYPGRRPGELLLELADKLCWAGPASQWEALHDDLRIKVDELHAELDKRVDPADPITHLEHALFGRALDTFASLLGSLGRMTVLILDTCEELTKLRPVGARLPNLEVTHEILRRAHNALPDHVRVVFAGRRLLAQAGDGWSVDPDKGPPGLAYLPPEIEYLRLHVIRGFDADEADHYFSRIERVPLSGPMREAVLMRSREAELAPVVSGQPQSVNRPRYNPYDLRLYADWLREEPDLPVETVASGETDPYVHVRIVERLKQHPDLQAALPAAVLLRRFDLAMIKPVLPAVEEDRLFRELGDQEWIDYRVGDGRSPTFLEISAHLYPRLLAYYQPGDRAKVLDDNHRDRVKAFVKFRNSLAPALADLVSQTPLGELSAIRVDAALRVMEPGPAAVVWNKLAFRLPNKADWSWAGNLTTFLLDDGAIRKADDRRRDDHPLLAGVLAVQIASMIHVPPYQDVSGRWNEVLEAAPHYPDEQTQDWLADRARIGLVAALARSGRLSAGEVGPLHDVLEGFQPLHADGERLQDEAAQLLASVCAALDAVLERVESGGDRNLLPDPDAVTRWAHSVVRDADDVGLRAFAVSLDGRVNALQGQTALAESMFLLGGRIAGGPEPQDGQPWFDWRLPASLVDRVRLEATRGLRAMRPGGVPLEDMLLYSPRLASRLDRIDSERLLSALTALQLEQDLPSADGLVALANADHYDATRQPVCAAHREVPPLFVTLARGFLALGRSDRALQLIRNREDAARSQRDELTLEVTQSAQLRTLCRLRLPEARSSLDECLNAPNSVADATEIWPMKSLCFGPGKFGPASDWYQQEQPGWDHPTKLHLASRSQAAFDFATAAELAERFRGFDTQSQSAIYELILFVHGLGSVIQSAKNRGNVYAAHALLLDGIEVDWIIMRALAVFEPRSPGRIYVLRKQWNPRFHSLKDLRNLFEADSTRLRPEELARLNLRALALAQDVRQPTFTDWAAAIPRRRQAEIALEEGELLALRVPARAVFMLEFAFSLFAKNFDHFGAWTSALLAAIAGIRAEDRTGAQRQIGDNVRPHYKQWRERAVGEGWGTELPDWSDLSGWGGVAESRWRDDNAVGPLRGWLDRLAHCVTWSQDPIGTGTHSALIRERLEIQYGRPLPIELALTPAKAVTTDRFKAVALAIARTSLPLILLLPTFLLIVWLLLVDGRIPGLAGWVTVLVPLTSFYAAWILAVVVAGLLSPKPTTPGLEDELLVRLAVAANAPNDDGGSGAVPVDLRMEWRSRIWHEHRLVKCAWTTPGLQPYREAARGFPVLLAKKLLWERYSSLWPGQRLHARIVPPRPAAAVDQCPWEAYLYEALSLVQARPIVFRWIAAIIDSRSLRLTEFDRIQIYRGANPEATISTATVWSGGRIQVAGGRLWGVGVGESWRSHHRDVSWSHEPPSDDPADLIKVLHLIGRPTRSGSHWELLISRYPDGVYPNQPIIVTAERLPTRRASLVLVQDEPADSEQPYRVPTDRQRVGELRAFAARVFADGAHAVIVLPQMPHSLVLAVVAALAEALPGTLPEPPGLERLLDAVSAIRQLIVSRPLFEVSDVQLGPLPPGAVTGLEARRELALDVCLFAHSRTPARH